MNLDLTALDGGNRRHDEKEIPPRAARRWIVHLMGTITINLISLLLFPMLVTDAFTADVFAVCILPILWAGYLFCRYRTLKERIVCYLSLLMAFYWLIPAMGIPIEFLGR